ncbi:MAG: right-handed parallel beta-helix repeat-containing protein [Pseudomonadota bacterium]|nr:right-handed parallel beta-helix repeat-containing protein [Pseudomonadota bacterium]
MTTFTLTATNPNGHTTATASVDVATVGDRFVDAANGSDAGGCAQPAPCKTIAKAMTVATNGSTVYLADGDYTPATQVNGATIADGVTLSATNAGAATIADNFILTAAGSAVLNGLVFGATNVNSPTCGGITANSTTGTPTLLMTGVLIKCIGAVNIGGTVKATMQPGLLPGGLYTAAMPNSYFPMITVSNSADLQIDGGIFDGNTTGAPAFGGGWFIVQNAATMTLSGVTVRNRTQETIALIDTAKVSLTNSTLLTSLGVAGDCGAAVIVGGTATLSLDHSQISNNPGQAICVNNGTSAATIHVANGSAITQNTVGIASLSTGATAVVTIDHSSFTNNGSGIEWNGFPGSSFTITSSTLTGNGTGISFQGLGGSLTLRGSNVSSNTGTGVSVGQAGATAVSADL